MEKKKEIADYYFHNLMFDCVEERLIDITRVNSCVSLGGHVQLIYNLSFYIKRKILRFLFFQITVLCMHVYRYLSKLAKRVTFQVFIWLMHTFYFLFFPVSFKKPLKNLKRMQGELRILPRAMHVEFYPVDCMKLHLTPWLVIFLMSF